MSTYTKAASKTIACLPNIPSCFPSDYEQNEMSNADPVRDQISDWVRDYPSCLSPAQLDELVELMVEVAMNRSPTIKIGRDAEYPTSYVQERFGKITSEHIEKVLDGIKENTTRVWNTKAYLLSALFNSVSTIDNHYTMLVNHDMNSGL